MADEKVGITLENAIEVIYAGGASTISATSEGYIASGRAYNLIGLLEERFPDFELDLNWGRKQVAYNGLSENIVAAQWTTIDDEITSALDNRPKSVLITYGTDGMEQFVRHLRSVFQQRLMASGQTIIVTGANKDIEEEDTDAWDNLMFALEQCASEEIAAGVYVAFHRDLIPANETVKLPYVPGSTQTFVSVNSKRYKKALADQQATAQSQISALIEKFGHQPDESIATIYDVNSARLDHQKFIDTVGLHEDTTAIILNLYRCGTANTTKPGKSVLDLVHYMRVLQRIVCFGVTENGQPVDLHAYETSVKLREAGVVPLYNMLRDVALVKLYLLGTSLSRTELINAMLKNEVGEIDESLINEDDIEALLQLYKD